MEQLDNLPDEVLLNIFSFFNKRDHGQASIVNKHFYKVSADKSLSNLPWPLLDYSQPPTEVKTLSDKFQDICDTTLLTNGKIILSTFPGYLYVCDVKQNKCQLLNGTHSNCILLALSNGQVVSGARVPEDNSLKLWDINRGRSLKTLVGHTAMITALTELPNGHVVSASVDNTLKVWNIEKGECLININTGLNTPIMKLITLSNGNILCGSQKGVLHLRDATNNYKRLYSLVGHTASISALVELSTGEILSASKDKTCKLWDMNSKKCVGTFITPNNNSFITNLIILPNKKQIACLTERLVYLYSKYYNNPALISKDKKDIEDETKQNVWIWNRQTKTYLPRPSLEGNRTHINSLHVLPSGQFITVCTKELQCWFFPELKFKHELNETNLPSNLNNLNFK